VLESLETKYPDKLKELLARIYAGSNLGAVSVRSSSQRAVRRRSRFSPNIPSLHSKAWLQLFATPPRH
jgi:hypothetical protein